MAQRFGGKHSPDGGPPGTPQTDRPMATARAPSVIGPGRAKGEGRAGFLGILALTFLFPAFTGSPRELVLGLIAGGILILAAFLTREGIRAQAAYDDRRVARRPAIPRKIFGAALTGVALAVGGLISQTGLIFPLLFGVLGAGLHLMAFGPDPLADKGAEGVDQFQADRVARAVDEAEAHLAGMKDAILRAGDRAIEARVDRFATTARALFRGIEGDPGDLTAARKYLSVYLQGARDATVKFADHFRQTRDPKARADYEALLAELETTFAQKTKDFLSDGSTDLDVEIAVLRDRLKLET